MMIGVKALFTVKYQMSIIQEDYYSVAPNLPCLYLESQGFKEIGNDMTDGVIMDLFLFSCLFNVILVTMLNMRSALFTDF